ncbi:MAG: acetolactate synthase small subunit [Myxococcota bacterium]
MSSRSLRVFVADLEDTPGVLNRVTSLFRRRGYNIVSLNVGRTHRSDISRMTLVAEADDDISTQLRANLEKLQCVLHVEDVTKTPILLRDLSLIKLQVDAAHRMEVFKLCEVFNARVVDVAIEGMIIEVTGTPEEIRRLTAVLLPFGIVEMVQCGAIVMTRPANASGRDRAA